MYDKRYFMTIAASDNSGGAGIQQDLKVAERLGFWGLSVITGITVQDFSGLDRIYPLPLEIIKEQFIKNVTSFPLGIIKIGALCSLEIAKLITELLLDYPDIPLVIDPVIAPTKGKSFIAKKDIAVYRKLIERANLLTPNKQELELLTNTKIKSYQDAIKAAELLVEETVCNVYIKGGHFTKKEGLEVKEYLISPNNQTMFTKAKSKFSYSHGTGCFFASAVACNLLKYADFEKACQVSTQQVSEFYSQLNLNK